MAEVKKKTKMLDTFRNMDEKSLIQQIADLRKQLVEHHRANAASELPSPAVIGKTRKQIAQALIVLGQKTAKRAKEQEK